MAPTDWARTTNQIIYSAQTGPHFDLFVLPLDSHTLATAYLQSSADKLHATFSPNGQLVAYSSNESGRFEVYVQPFPVANRKWQVSINGGYEPRWRRDGREIFYLAPDRRLMAAAVSSEPAFDTPQTLFQTPVAMGVTALRAHYDVSADGQRFLLAVPTVQKSSASLRIQFNWTTALAK